MEVSPGFLLLLGILFWLDEGVGLLPWGLLACALHELGHITASAALNGAVRELSLTAVGAELRIDYDVPLTYGQDSLVALAGPAANLLFGTLALYLHWELAAAVSLTIGGFNLLPIPPLDGGRVLYGLLALHLDTDWAERLMTALSGCLLGVLAGVGAMAAAHYGNATLLLTALWMLAGVLRRGGG
ncbi:MAG: site-2 protease family protein [Oscillospiraceae bacterium]|nr:site-2 protease family protein [Oscillospiraceae bacterium]